MTDKEKALSALKIAKDSNTIKLKGNVSTKDVIIYNYLNKAYDVLRSEIENGIIIIKTPEQLKLLITQRFNELLEADSNQITLNKNIN